MFTCLSNLVWGAQEETDAGSAFKTSEVEHSTHEEEGEWLVISTGSDQQGEKSKSGKFLCHPFPYNCSWAEKEHFGAWSY